MTQLATHAAEMTYRKPVRPAGRGRRSKRIIVGVLIGSLLASAGARHLALALQQRAYEKSPYAIAGSGDTVQSSSSLGSLDSYFMILLLGGLRGPLVMFLWSQVESQKNDRTLADVDTMIEMIRLLQPEFDSVHIFQAWNKAYNISIQIASLSSRYSVILDAVRYLERVDHGRPNNLNILLSLNQLFQHKLGTTPGDSVYYHRQVRADSKWRRVDPQRAVGALDQRMPPMLDPAGNLLPELIQPKTPRPAGLMTRVVVPQSRLEAFQDAARQLRIAINPPGKGRSGDEAVFEVPEEYAHQLEAALRFEPDIYFIDAEWNDGSTMQYLPRYGPFPDGLSPLAIGYNYVKRAEVLMNRTGQTPAQGGGPGIIDSRPAVELKAWNDTEWTRALAAEAEAFGREVTKERREQFRKSADVRITDQPKQPDRLANALLTIQLCKKLVHDSRQEYYRHVNSDLTASWKLARFVAPMDETQATEQVIRGDEAYIRAMMTQGQERKEWLERASRYYSRGLTLYEYVNLRYYFPGESEKLVYPAGVTRLGLRAHIDDAALISKLHQAAVAAEPKMAEVDQWAEERAGVEAIHDRVTTRLALIDEALGQAPATQAATQSASPPASAPSDKPATAP